MGKTSTFIDVNREDYIKSLITDVTKQAHLSALPERAQIIYNYIMTNGSADSNTSIDKNGMVVQDGHYLIKSSNRLNKYL